MVMETRRRFVIGFGGLVANEKGGGGDDGDHHENEPTRHQSWIASFGVSPLVMGTTDGPTVVPDPLGADAASCSFHGVTRWVGETRRLMPNFMLHDLVTGQYVPVVPPFLLERLGGFFSLPLAVNHKWFAVAGKPCDFSGSLGIGIAKLGDPLPADTSVGVKLKYPSDGNKVAALFFNKSSPNELVVIVSQQSAPLNSAFVVVDVEKSFSSKSLCAIVETNTLCVHSGAFLTENAVVVTKRDGSRSFIQKGAILSPFASCCFEFPENGTTPVAIPQTQSCADISQLSASLFAVSYNDKWCGIWDCNDMTKPLVSVVPGAQQQRDVVPWYHAEADSGFLFFLQGNELTVKEPLTGCMILRVTMPPALLYEVGHPFCCP